MAELCECVTKRLIDDCFKLPPEESAEALRNSDEESFRSLAGAIIRTQLDPTRDFNTWLCNFKPISCDKDEKRILDIVTKSNKFGRCSMLGADKERMIQLAETMNKAITDEDKRQRRAEAARRYGLYFIGRIFEH